MRLIQLAVSKCILILSISIISASEVFKFNDLKKEEIIANGLNEIDEIRAKSSSSPNTADNKNDGSKLNNYRRSPEIEGHRYKKLVKRIVPHNYYVKDFEYDPKFKTLFKPLLRIHKNNLKPDYTSDEEEPSDLVYVLHDEKFDDASESNVDESLLKPFSTKSAQMEYIPREYKAIKLSDLNNSPYGQRFKSVDSRNQIKNKYEYFKHELEDDRSEDFSKNSDLKYRDSIEDSLDPIKPELYKILHKKAPYIVILHDLAKRAAKPRKIQQLSGKGKKSWKSDKMKINKKLKQTSKLLSDRKKHIQPQQKKEKKAALMFGPIGGIISKQYDKEIIETLIQRPLVAKQELRLAQPIQNPNTLPDVLKALVRNERDSRAKNDRSVSSDSRAGERIKSIFVGVGHINSKQITMEERLRQANGRAYQKKTYQHTDRKPRADANIEEQTKLALLNEISRYKANKLKEGKSYKKGAAKLRSPSNMKSGEEEEIQKNIKNTLDDDEVSTKAPDSWRPNYPFWNYWTYDKQIELDDCKGQLVQHGRICVGAWAGK